jgi:hypothetical protein
VLEGFLMSSGAQDRYFWFADGAFVPGETLTFSGSATSGFDIDQIAGIANPGDLATVTASSPIGDLTLDFTAVPEPGTALLVMLGLLGLAYRRRRAGRAA